MNIDRGTGQARQPEGDAAAEKKAQDEAAKRTSDAAAKRRSRSRTVLVGATAGPTSRLRTARATLLGGSGSTLGSG